MGNNFSKEDKITFDTCWDNAFVIQTSLTQYVRSIAHLHRLSICSTHKFLEVFLTI